MLIVKNFSKVFSLASLIVVFVLLVSACAPQTTSTDVSNYDVIIDVRSPQEFSQSSLDSAVNINVESPDFVSSISSLDKNKVYNVYCRSGRRSAVAVEIMKDNGFMFVNDLGSLDNASKVLGIPIS